MNLLDAILNLAALLLWVNWRVTKSEPFFGGKPRTLLGTLRRAEPSRLRGWHILGALLALLLLRAVLYWELGGALAWMPKLHLGVITVTFRSDFFVRMLVFSFLSFAVALVLFYSWVLLLSLLNRHPKSPDPVGRLIRLLLGPLARLGTPLKLVLPLLAGVLLWVLGSLLLERIGILPAADSFLHRLEQGILIGLHSYLSWQFLIAGLLALHVVHSYVYLGEHPFWSFVNSTGETLLTPLHWLPMRVGKVDFAPLLGIAIVLLAARGSEQLLLHLYSRLPI